MTQPQPISREHLKILNDLSFAMRERIIKNTEDFMELAQVAGVPDQHIMQQLISSMMHLLCHSVEYSTDMTPFQFGELAVKSYTVHYNSPNAKRKEKADV